MSTPRYVQHISGQGEKYAVERELEHSWKAHIHYPTFDDFIFIPKSEYRLCDPPPETWRDVTAECEWSVQLGIAHYSGITHYKSVPSEVLRVMGLPDLYRLRKVQVNFPASGIGSEGTPAHCGWAFVVEERQP